ncbi:PREDICTED: uncharacterized protein LOC104706749 [Camelina sativa]|uniref:Uncharacterized protein LOC104706749 n=1 Tax=Camelina sativa TaxID=90675 RepID=A0ABM0T5Q6_CAMSA|nr:PREDICTED: uncharacterized protein LOC104706749 [Camelina sativa]
MPRRPKKNRIKAAHECPSNPKRVTRDGRIVTCGNCKKVGHNHTNCKNEAFVKQGPSRKRGRPRKILDDGDINPYRPRKRITSQSQPSIPPPTPNQSQSSVVSVSCTAPPPFVAMSPSSVSSGRGRGRRGCPPGRGRGRRGRPPGRGQARKKVTVPRGQGVYMCPFSDRVFECWGPKSKEIGGGSQPK